MRILIVNDLLIHGGAEMQGLREKKILEENGHEVFMLTFDNNFPRKSLIYNEERGFYNIPINNSGVTKLINKFLFNKKLFLDIRNFINKVQPEIIHINNLYLAPITQYKSMNKYKAFQTIRDYSAVCPLDTCINIDGEVCLGSKYNNCYINCGKNIRNISKIFRGNIYNKVRIKYISEYVSPSEKLTKYCKEHGYKINCINNPFDFKKFEKFSKEIDYINKKYLYYGNINKDKGILEFIDAFIEFSKDKNDVELVIAGRVNEDIKEKFESLCNKAKIKYIGYKKYEDMIEILKQVYAIVVPSVWMENYPNTVLEGMATKTLVLGSNRGGIPNMLENNRGIVFDIMNKKSVVDKLNYSYYLDGNRYKEIVNTAYSYTINNNNTSKYYLRIINKINSIK